MRGRPRVELEGCERFTDSLRGILSRWLYANIGGYLWDGMGIALASIVPNVSIYISIGCGMKTTNVWKCGKITTDIRLPVYLRMRIILI